MGDLHDALEAGGYTRARAGAVPGARPVLPVRRGHGHLRARGVPALHRGPHKPDGSDLGLHLARLFDVLNTPPDKRQKNLDETLAAFPYVNGELFAEHLGFAEFTWACFRPGCIWPG